ncbi:MAG: hypothetical protein WCL71_04705 [Deltaproteobacteria bacterium]
MAWPDDLHLDGRQTILLHLIFCELVDMQHYTLLERNLIYTSVMRGKKLVTIIGQPMALAMAVKNKYATKRLTNLSERIAKQ